MAAGVAARGGRRGLKPDIALIQPIGALLWGRRPRRAAWIERGLPGRNQAPDETIAPVAPRAVLHGGDGLTFVGRADEVLDPQATAGLVSSEQKHVAVFDAARQVFFEAVLGPGSPLLGRTLKEGGFRGQ